MELILAISIVGFVIIYILSGTVLNEIYMLSKLKNSNYYEETYKLLQSNFENYIQQSGLDEDVLKNIVTKEQMEEDTKIILTNIYDGLDEEISTKKLENKLKKNIDKQVDTKSLNDESKKAIEDFINEICKEYKATISNSNYEKQINALYSKLVKYLRLGQKVLSISIGVSFIILIVLNLKRIYRIATNVGIAFLASGSILSIANLYINTKIKVQYLTILNEPISVIVRNIAKDILDTTLKYGVLLLVAGLVLSVVGNGIHNLVKYKNYTQEDED